MKKGILIGVIVSVVAIASAVAVARGLTWHVEAESQSATGWGEHPSYGKARDRAL